ncbi:MAG TPA: 4-hydroxy-tetrahydrodipicolinate synthase [Candidatus Binatia bacterium]
MFSGSMAAIVTPFCDGRIDAQALERLIEFQVENGTSAIVPCGSTGESATLTHEEHAEVVRLAVKFVRGRVPIIAGTGSNSTSEAIVLTRAAKEAGAAAALLISPYYNKPTQEGIYQHYKAIADSTRFPLIVYNIPGRTASKIEATTIARLAELEHIVGVKEATGSLDEVQEVIRLCGDKIELYSGDDSLTLPIMAVGGVGVISVAANVMPKASAQMLAACRNGDWDTARRLHYHMLPVIRALFLETNPIPVKAAVAMMGYCRDEIRLPLLPMSEAPKAKLRAVMEQFGLLKS